VNKPQTGHLKGDKLKNLREIRVEKTEEFKPGQVITVGSFKEGEMVSVTGVAIGKGFAGTIRRYHHNRGPMTHGSKAHRRPGAAGAGSTPGRLVKGRKMPGRMGGRQITEKRVQVVKVEPDKNLLYLRGPVPGKPGNLIVVSEA
jgi:large subunit ribosomal protein L3